MEILSDYNLEGFNTFRVPARAKFFVEVQSEKDLMELFEQTIFRENPKMFLGGGSNVLFTKDFEGIVIKISILGKKIIEENEHGVVLDIGAGENWHEVVSFAVKNNWGGIENLALIPGTVGAAPVQNIAAYGGNLSDVFVSLQAWNVETGKIEKFSKEECKFGYRDSVFKHELQSKYIVTNILLRLSKESKLETSYYQIGINYDSIKEELKKVAKEPYDIEDVFNAVVSIRTRKLPDPKKVPTVGSFFLNAIVSKEKYEELKNRVPELQCYPPDQLQYKNLDIENLTEVKVATGRLLQEAGWLGKWIGNVGIHDKHALVIVTNGKATGEEILAFSKTVANSIEEKFGLTLVPEVNFI
jgi:UDP-N-acetylmuramate dehydrogenase